MAKNNWIFKINQFCHQFWWLFKWLKYGIFNLVGKIKQRCLKILTFKEFKEILKF